MIRKGLRKLSIVRQCQLPGLKRSTLYYKGKGENPLNQKLMRIIDEEFMATQFYGSRQMASRLRRMGYRVGRKWVHRLMRLMGLSVIYQKPNTSKPHPEHRIYPYLLRGLTIDRPNQVWCTDITYIPIHRGFLYLVAVSEV